MQEGKSFDYPELNPIAMFAVATDVSVGMGSGVAGEGV